MVHSELQQMRLRRHPLHSLDSRPLCRYDPHHRGAWIIIDLRYFFRKGNGIIPLPLRLIYKKINHETLSYSWIPCWNHTGRMFTQDNDCNYDVHIGEEKVFRAPIF